VRPRPSVEPELEDLVALVLRGEVAAWTDLWRLLEPRLTALVRNPRLLGRLARRDDDVRNVVLEVMRKLHEDGHRRLTAFAEVRAKKPDLALMSWLAVLARRTAIDYLRGHGEYLDQRHLGGVAGAWVEPVTLPTDGKLPRKRPPITDLGTARQLLSYAGAHLPPEQRAALEAWVQGHGFAEIQRDLGLAAPKDAERLVRAALERLRRKFVPEPGEESG
jgi:DNA-directed RNA polymerase specialized sigma24 family protein